MRGTQTDGSAAIWAEGGFLATGSETWPPTPLWSRRQVARHPEIPNAATATGRTSVVALRPDAAAGRFRQMAIAILTPSRISGQSSTARMADRMAPTVPTCSKK